ncbi:hypothetical protein ACR9E3_07240 [Actinomycetospora sp. C-140]
MSPANPEEKSEKATGIGLTFPQIIASALAAATAAILGSFMGVLGTIGGAAVASIISTVGSALYQKSLEVTRDRVKERLVVAGPGGTKVANAVGRVTGVAPGAAPGRPGVPPQGQPRPGVPGRPPAPGAPGVPATRAQPTRVAGPPTPGPGVPVPPGHQQQRPGTPPGDPTRRVPGPVGPPSGRPADGRVALRADGLADPTRVHPRATPPPPQDTAARPTAFIPQSRQTGTPPGGGPTQMMGPGGPGGPPPGDAVTQVAPLEPEPSGPRRFSLAGLAAGLKGLGWKTWVTLGGVAASIFVIALLASFGVETAAGHPLSGGASGTSVGSIFGQQTDTSEATTTPSDSSSTDETSATTSSRQQDDQNGTDTQQPGSGNDGGGTTTSRSTQSSQSGLVPNLLPRGGSGSGGASTNG